MSEEYLVAEEIPTEEPIVEEPVEEIPQRVNPFCVIRKEPWGEYNVHDIQTNDSWGANPYEDYAVVPDAMVPYIMETQGFCDITLNDDGTEVVDFTPLEIPVIPEPPHEPTAEERIAQLEEENANSIELEAELLYELSLMQLGLL